MVRAMVRPNGPLKPMEAHGGAGIHFQSREDHTPEQVDEPRGGCDSTESPSSIRLLTAYVALWREDPMLEQICWQDL